MGVAVFEGTDSQPKICACFFGSFDYNNGLGAQPLKLWPFFDSNSVRYGRLAQLVRAPALHAGGHWFESSIAHFMGEPGRWRQQSSLRCLFRVC